MVRQYIVETTISEEKTYPDSVSLVSPPNTTIPKTLAALPSSQYATDLSLTLGKLDFVLEAPSAASATADPEADLLKTFGNAFLALANEVAELNLLVFGLKGEATKFLRKADFVA
jgi:hypothetical protein